MKIVKLKIVIILVVLNISYLTAQNKNNISIDPFLPVFGTAQVQYERGLNDKFSISLSVGYKTSSGLFTVHGFDRERIKTDDFNFKGIKIIPEFRWYLQKDVPSLTGFYTGAYFKYQNYTDDIIGSYTDNDNVNHDIAVDATINTIAFGLEVGYKLQIKKRFFIDFIIVGPGLSFNTFESKEKKTIPDTFYDDISEALSNYGIFEITDTDIQIIANAKSDVVTLPAFRYGIKFGYSF